MVQHRIAGRLVAALAIVLAFSARVVAQDLTAQFPAMSNAGAIVDVKGLLASKLGQKEGWQGKLMGGYSNRPLAVPAYANRFAVAAYLEVPELAPMWQFGLIDVSVPVDLSKVAREQRGIADKVDGHAAVTTQFNIMHVALSEKQIVTIWPAQRQIAARLLGKQGMTRGAGEYLKGALRLDTQHQVVLALDLDGAFSGASIRKAMAMGGLSSLDQSADLVKTSDALASVKGVSVKVAVDDSIKIQMVGDFESTVPVPAAAAKAFCLEMLGAAGLDTAAFEALDYQVKGKQLVASGSATTKMVQELLALLIPDSSNSSLERGVAVTETSPTAPPAGQPPKPTDPVAAASLEYYRSIAGALDKLSAGTSMAANATRLRAEAKKIQQLPVLNVDPDLLNWGSGVADQLNQCAMILVQGQASAQNAALSIASPTAEATYSDSSFDSTSDTNESRAAFRNAQQQRRQAAQTQRQQAADQAFQVISAASAQRSKIRVAMTQKYGVEF